MINRCLNANPILRPTSHDMLSEIFSWILFSHIDNKDELKALDMIEKGGFDIDYKTRGFFGHVTALHLACKFECNEVVMALIQEGANINAVEKEGNTPLHWAVKFGNNQLVERFINAGTNLDSENDQGQTPIFFACSQ